MEIETTWGTITIELLNGKVSDCSLPFLADQPEQPFHITSAGYDSVSEFVASVFSGQPTSLPLLTELEGTHFQRKVWRAIADIPLGATRTYGELARAIGRPKATRAVGSACGRNPVPLFIPCHRVKGASGQLGGFFYGLPWKILLLEIEAGTTTIIHP